MESNEKMVTLQCLTEIKGRGATLEERFQARTHSVVRGPQTRYPIHYEKNLYSDFGTAADSGCVLRRIAEGRRSAALLAPPCGAFGRPFRRADEAKKAQCAHPCLHAGTPGNHRQLHVEQARPRHVLLLRRRGAGTQPCGRHSRLLRRRRLRQRQILRL